MMSAKPATWPPNPQLPEATRLHARSDGLPGAILKSKGTRPWRVVGTPGTFTQHPTSAAVDKAEVNFLKALRLLHHKHDSAAKGGAKYREKTQPMRDTIASWARILSPSVKPSKRVAKILSRCRAEGKYPSRRTVERVIEALDKAA